METTKSEFRSYQYFQGPIFSNAASCNCSFCWSSHANVPPGGPGFGQQIFYGQGPPALIPPQPGFGYQQQLVPGMRPAGAPMPNFFMPMVQQQGQQGQRQGGRRAGAGPAQQTQQPMPMMQQQVLANMQPSQTSMQLLH